MNATAPSVLLNARVRDSYAEVIGSLQRVPGMRVIAEGDPPEGAGYSVTARLLETDASQLLDFKLDECFGPTTVIVRYQPEQVGHVIDQLPGSLTATIHAEADERELVAELTTRLRRKAGRLLYAGFPTGVLVSWGQHHGGPWPATNSQHTSVGATAVRRFQRPMAWQSAPPWVLPDELLDCTTNIPRRVDGTLVSPS